MGGKTCFSPPIEYPEWLSLPIPNLNLHNFSLDLQIVMYLQLWGHVGKTSEMSLGRISC